MVATVPSASVTGLEARRVRVEVSIARGTPMIQIVGLAESAVREGRERIRAAAAHVGLHVPGLRIIVNLAPAGLRKHGAAFDLPILVGILAAAGRLAPARARRWAMVGELGLDGRLRPVRGALSIALHAARAGDVEGLLLPLDNLRETGAVSELPVRGADHLEEVLAFLAGEGPLPCPGDLPPEPAPASPVPAGELADVRGQAAAKRALEVAAAGGHNLLLRGAPGAGKTSLARCLPGILPPMSTEEAVEVTAVHSVAGRLPAGSGLLRERPFRAPHHTVSETGLVGGGSHPRPGEVSLAHRGVLFLDELPEFGRHVLEVLRQPLEEGVVHLVRARASATFPARFLLVAAMNPCPCGYQTEGDERCTCDPGLVRRYVGRVSGPLLDRIDLHVDVPAVQWEDLARAPDRPTTAEARERVREARDRAARRLNGRTNAELRGDEVRRHCRPDRGGESLLAEAVNGLGLSARGWVRVLKVARTLADLEAASRVAERHVAEALFFRDPERRG